MPSSISELHEIVQSTPRVLAIGAGTKPRLSAVDCPKISLRELKGIVEYEPSEFTFTALAGTTILEIDAALRERGQYLPFDPMLVRAGATVGGTVAAGLNGPGRFRFGGLRDFILGVKFIDGLGRLLRLGGKVVKNAAGFDVPKFMVGSLGRFGMLTEITFKVFPRPVATLSLRLAVDGLANVIEAMIEIAKSRWQAEALDLMPNGKGLCVRLAGPAAALEEISREIRVKWAGKVLSEDEATEAWNGLREFSWAYPDGPLIKVPLTPATLLNFNKRIQELDGARIHVSGGGNVAFVSLPSAKGVLVLGQHLVDLGLCGMTLRGDARLWCGLRPRYRIEQAVKEALDPKHRFPALNEEE